MKVYIEELNLHNYRNFKELKLNFNNNIILILGDNGTGKTNILESISLLSPGKGIRGAKYEDITSKNEENWSNNIYLQSKLGTALVKYDFLSNTKSRTIYYNGAKLSNLELSNLANIIWLTPQMDSIFISPAAERRRFLDRIVYNFHKEHAANLNKYNHLATERLKLLNQKTFHKDENWLKILEEKIAVYALKITNLRENVVKILQESISSLIAPFPKAKLSINTLCETSNFLEEYSIILEKNRYKDTITKRTNFGINKQELTIEHQEKKQQAKLCSTGEQKALLISILLGQIEANITIAQTTPILLLDELFVHLDDKRKDSLAQYIINSKLQTFITATDTKGLEEIAKNAQIIHI